MDLQTPWKPLKTQRTSPTLRRPRTSTASRPERGAPRPILSETARRWPQSRPWPHTALLPALPPAESPQARTHRPEHRPEGPKERRTLWRRRKPRGGAGDSGVQTHTWHPSRGAAEASSEQMLSARRGEPWLLGGQGPIEKSQQEQQEIKRERSRAQEAGCSRAAAQAQVHATCPR